MSETQFIDEVKKEEPKATFTPPAQPISLESLYSNSSEEVRIPSNGLVYPNATGIMNSKTIPMRYMRATDEDDMTSPTLLRQGKWLTKILSNCIVSSLINPEDLLVGDRNALLFWLRQTAYGTSYNLSVTCPNCTCDKKSFQNEFKLDKLQLKTLEVNPVIAGKNEFEFELPSVKAKVIFALLTNKMVDELAKEEELKSNQGITQEKRITSILKKQIIEIAGTRDKKQIDDFIDKGMFAKDSLALRSYIEKITPDIILKQEAVCPYTGKLQEFNIPIEAQFFLPTATA